MAHSNAVLMHFQCPNPTPSTRNKTQVLYIHTQTVFKWTSSVVVLAKRADSNGRIRRVFEHYDVTSSREAFTRSLFGRNALVQTFRMLFAQQYLNVRKRERNVITDELERLSD